MPGCVPNIGPRQQRLRRTSGLMMLGLATAAAIWLVASGAPAAWRLAVFPLLFMGGLGIFQVRAGTCVMLAARGQRDPDTGPEPVIDAAELRASRSQAGRVVLQSVIFATAITAALIWILPEP